MNDATQFKDRIPNSAFAFRGYNVTNHGRSAELLAHSAYGSVVSECLEEFSAVASSMLGRPVDLVNDVRTERPATLATYGEDIAMISAIEKAQLRLLDEFFGIQLKEAKMTFGYSLGEIAAVAAGGVIEMTDAMTVPLSLADDCSDLANDVTLGVLFSRGRTLSREAVKKLCLELNQDANGVVGISAQLSPNSLLVMGQYSKLDELKVRMDEIGEEKVYLRKSSHRFPPLHTPITWERNIPNRAAKLMHLLPGGLVVPNPPVVSLVTGRASYTETNVRETLHDWIDHPQLLWDAVYETLTRGVKTIVHVGPEPNIIPATYKRLRDNVEAETQGSIGMRALTAVVHHPWVKALLPERTALLRVMQIEHVVLEDWLLDQNVE